MTLKRTQGSPVEAGWRALKQGLWAEAAHWFDKALAEDGDDPWALEGRAWAAWWVSDAATLFPARERAFHAYRERGALASAARAAIWIGSDYHEFSGEHAVANGWYRRARRILEELPLTPEHGWLAFHEGAYAMELAEDTEAAKAHAADAVAIGRSLGVPDIVFLGVAVEGLALVTEGAVEEGMRCLDEASVAATSGELRKRIAVARILCYMIYACERVRDFDRAVQWCRKMEKIASGFGCELAIGVCQARYGGVLMLQGQWGRAEHKLVQAGVILARARPPMVAESDARLGELRRRQGRTAEAAELLSRAVPHPLAVLGLASMALDADEPERTAELVEDLIDATPASSITQLADALGLLAAARARLGQLDAARTAVASLAEIASMVGNRPFVAMAAAADGAVALAAGDDPQARRLFEKAADSFERGGLPYEAAWARADLAVALRRLGRSEAAAAEEATAAYRLAALGAAGVAERLRQADTYYGGGSAQPRDPLPAQLPAQLAGLTAREVQVLAILTEGLTDREIALRLSISAHTVHRHVSNILAKLGMPSRTAAAAYGARHGMGAELANIFAASHG